jgi:hypothetical protein
MLRRVALVRTAVSEGYLASIVIFLRSLLQLLDTANVVPSSAILVALMMEVIRSSETSVLTRAVRRNLSENGILHKWGFLERCSQLVQ